MSNHRSNFENGYILRKLCWKIDPERLIVDDDNGVIVSV